MRVQTNFKGVKTYRVAVEVWDVSCNGVGKPTRERAVTVQYREQLRIVVENKAKGVQAKAPAKFFNEKENSLHEAIHPYLES